MRLAIRADGGPDIGYGHLVRTGALAERALQAGDRVTYATRTPQHVTDACPRDVGVVALDPDDNSEFLDWLADGKQDVVLVDSYSANTDRQRAIAERVPRLAVVLDDARFVIRSDVLINGNVYALDLDYEWTESEPMWCLGPDYLLLREEIRELIGKEPSFRETAERALITMGGSDINDTTPAVVRAFDGINLHVDVIVGPGFENRPAIDRAAAETDATFDVVKNPDDLPERMLEADLAVSATGSTVYELLALRTPTIGLPQADNQEPIADALDERGAVVTLDETGTDGLAGAIQSLVDDPDRRRSLRDRGSALVDGQGVERVYDIITEEPL